MQTRLKRLIFLFFTVLLAVAFVYAISNSLRIVNIGTVKSVGINVYANSACTIPLYSIDWGLVSPTSTNTRNAWLRNEGTVQVKVTLTMEAWTPTLAKDVMRLNWDSENAVIDVGKVKAVVFSLNVYANASAITNFSFDIVVTGNEV